LNKISLAASKQQAWREPRSAGHGMKLKQKSEKVLRRDTAMCSNCAIGEVDSIRIMQFLAWILPLLL
jgi:hypothetical protein